MIFKNLLIRKNHTEKKQNRNDIPFLYINYSRHYYKKSDRDLKIKHNQLNYI